MFSKPATISVRLTICGCRTCCRLNASSWRVRATALRPAPWISFEVGAHRIALLQVRGEQLAVAEDDRQEVVEVVRDARRQLPDGVHLAGLPHLRLERSSAP